MQVPGFFLEDRVKRLATQDRSMQERQPFKALLEHDFKTLHALGMQALGDLFAATHAGMVQDEFETIVRDWFVSARHPKLARGQQLRFIVALLYPR